MTKATLKKELHKAIDNIDDDSILEAVYTILNYKVSSNSYPISDEDWRIIEDRETLYKAGKLKTYTVKEVKRKLQKNSHK